MKNFIMTICLVVFVFWFGGCCSQQTIEDELIGFNESTDLQTPIDLKTVKWSKGSFADLEKKEIVLIVLTEGLFEMDLDYIAAKWDSIDDVQKIVDEFLNAKDDPNSGAIGCLQAIVWFIPKDGSIGLGFDYGEFGEFSLLKDSNRKVRASNELYKVVQKLIAELSEEEEKPYPHPNER